MREEDFNSSSPGRCVQTTYLEDVVIRGVPQQVVRSGASFVPDRLPVAAAAEPVFLGQLIIDVQEAAMAIGSLQSRIQSLPNPMVVLNAFRKREVQKSSQIENTIATIREMAFSEAGVESPRDDVRQVFNNLSAFRLGLTSEAPLGAFYIRAIHAELMKNEPHSEPGAFRTRQVIIGAHGPDAFARARFIPPPPEQVPPLVDNLFESLSTERSSGVPWLIQIAVAHYQFETIHPFLDGNGRIGRLLVNILPVKLGYILYPIVNISEHLAEHRQEYYDALLGVSQRGDWLTWIRLFLRAAAIQARADLKRAERLLELRERYFAKFSGNSRATSWDLVELFFQQPVLRPARVGERLNISSDTTMRSLRRLQDAGIIREVTGKQTHQLFVAEEILEHIE